MPEGIYEVFGAFLGVIGERKECQKGSMRFLVLFWGFRGEFRVPEGIYEVFGAFWGV